MRVDSDRLREARLDQMLTVEEVAQRTGISRSSLWRLEHGKYGAFQSTLRKLGKLYGVNPREFRASTHIKKVSV